ncbi:protein of unassigned function [Methylobacterium oryzae CBMB20]|uniref:Protein of unassigned function n=1 Tax=Methylobacterium oryzae CBMB20 TaxID=693986 RepID=A0A089NRV3_9HYPH|nr:protein of unassigned function [Methylobacterium oryzae CBMB20]
MIKPDRAEYQLNPPMAVALRSARPTVVAGRRVLSRESVFMMTLNY